MADRHQARSIRPRRWPAGASPALERSGARLELIPVTELARACGEFHDAVLGHLVAHRGDPRLSDAVLGASKRKVGDGWVWNRRAGLDISPLVGATLARWGVLSGAGLDGVPTIY